MPATHQARWTTLLTRASELVPKFTTAASRVEVSRLDMSCKKITKLSWSPRTARRHLQVTSYRNPGSPVHLTLPCFYSPCHVTLLKFITLGIGKTSKQFKIFLTCSVFTQATSSELEVCKSPPESEPSPWLWPVTRPTTGIICSTWHTVWNDHNWVEQWTIRLLYCLNFSSITFASAHCVYEIIMI